MTLMLSGPPALLAASTSFWISTCSFGWCAMFSNLDQTAVLKPLLRSGAAIVPPPIPTKEGSIP